MIKNRTIIHSYRTNKILHEKKTKLAHPISITVKQEK